MGADAGRAIFRHKTKKQPFSDQLWGVAFLQVVVTTALTAYLWYGDELAWVFSP